MINIEDGRDRAVVQHRVGDRELVEVRVRIALPENRQVREPGGRNDVRARELVPLAEINVLRGEDGIVHCNLVQNRRTEVTDEPRVLCTGRSNTRHKSVAQHHPVARLDHVGRSTRLRHDHPGHFVIRDSEVDRGRIVVLLVRTGHIAVSHRVYRHAPGLAARDDGADDRRHPHFNVMRRARCPGDGSSASPVTYCKYRRELGVVVRIQRDFGIRRRRSIAVLRIDGRRETDGDIRQQVVRVRRVTEWHAVQSNRPRHPGNRRA